MHGGTRGWHALVLLVLLLTRLARADGIGGAAGVSSDDVFRGLSQNEGRLSVQGDLHYATAQWYGGLSAEMVRRGADHPGAELIAYAGYEQRWSDNWTGSLALRHYDYPGNAIQTRYNYDELSATLRWRELLGLTVSASPDTYAYARETAYAGGTSFTYPRFGSGAAYCYELTVRQPLAWGLSASGGVGYYDLAREIGSGYTYWSAGLGRQWRTWNFDLRYIGTGSLARRLFGAAAGDRLVVSALWFF